MEWTGWAGRRRLQPHRRGSEPVLLPQRGRSYTGTLEIQNRDNLQINVKTYEAGKTTGQAIFYLNRLIGGELSQGATVQLGFGNGKDLDSLKLQIDTNADGTPEREIAPHSVITGSQASDETPPTTTAVTRVVEPERGGNRPRPKEARVALRAKDAGSGIGAIYYRLQGEQQLRLYESPFTVSLNTTIYYGAVDKAGNAAPLQKLLVDDAPDSLATAEPLTTEDRLKRYIDPSGDEDWVVFEADSSSRYTVQLYTVQLYGPPEDTT